MYHRWTLRAVHHDQFEKSPGAVSAENQVSNWIFADFFHDQRASHDVLDVLPSDVVPKRRRENLHNGYRTTKPVRMSIACRTVRARDNGSGAPTL
jgi:hypothetical protein